MNAAAQAATTKSMKRTSSLSKLSDKQKNSKIGDTTGTETDSNVKDDDEDKIGSSGNQGGAESVQLD